MFLGVWGTTMYELMMVLVSTHALRTGVGSISSYRERALHLLCVGTRVAADQPPSWATMDSYFLRSTQW